MAWPERSLEEQRLFLDLMEDCHVCFRCGDTAEEEALYLALDLLPELETVVERLPGWKETPDTLTLRLEYPFFRPMRIRFVLSEIGEGEYRAKYWKSGFWLEHVDWDTQLLVRFEDIRTAELPGAMALVLKTQGREPRRLLREMRWLVRLHEWNEEEEPEELLTLDGITVARSTLESALYGRVHDIQGKLVRAAPFAEFLEVRLPY